MVRLLILIHFLFGSYTLQANTMKRCYEKKAVSYRITMDFTADIEAKKAIWEIYLHLPGDSILLDKYVSEKFYKDELLYDKEVSKHIIIGDAMVISQDVFIMMTRFEHIYIMKYHLLPAEKQVIQSSHYIEEDEEVLYDPYGSRYFTAAFKQFSPNQFWASWHRHKLLSFDYLSEKGFQLIFEKEVEKIPGTLPDDLDGHPTEIAEELKRVLNYHPDKKAGKFQYIGYLDEANVVPAMKYWEGKRGEGITYFFYKKESHLPLKVIRYEHSRKKWWVCNYAEEQTPINTIAKD